MLKKIHTVFGAILMVVSVVFLLVFPRQVSGEVSVLGELALEDQGLLDLQATGRINYVRISSFSGSRLLVFGKLRGGEFEKWLKRSGYEYSGEWQEGTGAVIDQIARNYNVNPKDLFGGGVSDPVLKQLHGELKSTEKWGLFYHEPSRRFVIIVSGTTSRP